VVALDQRQRPLAGGAGGGEVAGDAPKCLAISTSG
jgi:hypothetical protein